MGTDVYLMYEGKSEDSFPIEDGEYIRASIGMRTENRTLRILFPEEFWKNHGEKAPEYDFVKNTKLLSSTIADYLSGEVSETASEVDDGQQARTKAVMEMIGAALAQGDTVTMPGLHMSEDEKKEWARIVVAFFRRGLELQMQKKKPRVYISW